MARRLASWGHEVNIITSDKRAQSASWRWRVETVAGCTVHWLPVPYSNRQSYAKRIEAFVSFAVAASVRTATIPADVIFASSTPLTIAIPALYASWRTGVPYVFEVRDMWPDVPVAMGALGNPMLRAAAYRLEKLAYDRAARIVALAPGMGEDIVKKGVSAEKISVIPNAADLEMFGEGVQDPEALRREYAWLGDRPVVLYTGTFGKVNDLGYLVRIAAHMLEIDERICFVLIGDGVEREKIEAEARALGVLDRNLFLLDRRPKSEIARWTRISHLIASLASGPRVVWKDGVQNKFFDALAASKPVFCNFDGWQTEIARAAGAGFMTDPVDTTAAAAAIARHIHDDAWLVRAGAAAENLAVTRFDRDLLTRQLESILLSVAGTRAARQPASA